LSFFEKAFPQPMLTALQAAAARTRRRIHFLMVGWFPGRERDQALYAEAAAALAPSVDVRFLDGNDRALVETVWAAADIFLSLVDNKVSRAKCRRNGISIVHRVGKLGRMNVGTVADHKCDADFGVGGRGMYGTNRERKRQHHAKYFGRTSPHLSPRMQEF
jgi:hypothetical protein